MSEIRWSDLQLLGPCGCHATIYHQDSRAGADSREPARALWGRGIALEGVEGADPLRRSGAGGRGKMRGGGEEECEKRETRTGEEGIG
eukprot:765878-Hanusia_phi.AAC.3